MRKFYIAFVILFILGVGTGIYYLKVVRPGTANIPDHIVMETAFEEEYAFNFEEQPEKKVRLIEFMYTRCPDVCPVTTLEMSKLRQQLMSEGVFGDDVEFLTITIDPEGDTLDVLQDYASRFEVTSNDDGWKFLRGTEEMTEELADSLRFKYRDPGSGDIIHSTFTYLLDKNNNLVEQFQMGEGFNRDKAYKRIMNIVK